MKRMAILAALALTVTGIVAAVSVSAPGRVGGNDALTAARFSLSIDGYEIASFSELGGISSEVEVVEYREGGDDTIIRVLPGKPFPPTITLKRGMTSSMELWAWHELARSGDAGRGRPRT